ncbi:ATPase, partial [Escherichia coli]|nr:ATPase [Escherichia coli]
RLEAAWPAFGYAIALLPKIDVEARADFVLARLSG